MSRLANVTARECISALQKAGFVFERQKGSHVIMRNGGYTPIVPNPPGNIKPGTLRSIIRQAGLTVDEFLELL
jgi:predicted RNA binding protein YcfA (HicA-like mRNA interferase family)